MERNREELEAEKSEEQPRKPYSTPRVTKHGTVEELTRATLTGGGADIIYSA